VAILWHIFVAQMGEMPAGLELAMDWTRPSRGVCGTGL